MSDSSAPRAPAVVLGTAARLGGLRDHGPAPLAQPPVAQRAVLVVIRRGARVVWIDPAERLDPFERVLDSRPQRGADVAPVAVAEGLKLTVRIEPEVQVPARDAVLVEADPAGGEAHPHEACPLLGGQRPFERLPVGAGAPLDVRLGLCDCLAYGFLEFHVLSFSLCRWLARRGVTPPAAPAWSPRPRPSPHALRRCRRSRPPAPERTSARRGKARARAGNA